MNGGILAGLAAMTCYGTGSVLQSVAASRTTVAGGLDPRLLARLASQVPYVAGLALDLLGFAFNVIALQTMPLFVVQCMIAGSVGVTAAISATVLHVRLSRHAFVGLIILMSGLAMLTSSAVPGPSHGLPAAQAWALLGSTLAIGAASALSFRLSSRATFLTLSALTGLAFAGVGVAARALVLPSSLGQVATDPVAWALVAFGFLGILLFASALQRGSVTVASAVMFSTEVLAASAVGFALLGDIVPAGVHLYLAIAGVSMTVGGAILVASLPPKSDSGAVDTGASADTLPPGSNLISR
jgi:drug/metabolite transporter (DMT)-like permease